LVKISAKNDKFWYLNPILGKLGVAHDLDWWLVGKPMSTFYSLWLNFLLSVTVWELWDEMCTARLFSQGVAALKFYPNRVVLHQPFLASES